MNPSPSPALPRGFVFVESPEQFREPGALVVRVPRGIRSKQKLLAVLADKLHLPGYFGWNWDALEECLSDLSWLPPDRPVAIVHEDLPFGPRSTNRATYLDILRGAVDERTDRRRTLQVVLPSSLSDDFIRATTEPR